MHLAGVRREISSCRAQVTRCGEGGVVDVERVGHAVTVAVRGPRGPRRRDELHRADSVVVDVVAVEAAVVGVEDPGGAVTVQRRADDRKAGQPVGQQLSATELAVVGLHAADGGEQRPVQIAAGVGEISGVGGPAVCGQRHSRDTVRTGTAHRAAAGHVATRPDTR